LQAGERDFSATSITIMTTDTNSEKSQSKLYEMTVKGRNYRQTEEVQYFGETIEVVLRPLVDKEFLPLTAEMQEKAGVDEQEALDEIEEAKERGDNDPEIADDMMDMTYLDEEFVDIMQRAAKLGISHDEMGHTQDEVDFMVDNMVGGLSVEIGGLVLDVSGDVEDAEKFR
jgi:flagellin-like hook-associated protein FlgL